MNTKATGVIAEVRDELAEVRRQGDALWAALEMEAKPPEQRELEGNVQAGQNAILALHQAATLAERHLDDLTGEADAVRPVPTPASTREPPEWRIRTAGDLADRLSRPEPLTDAERRQGGAVICNALGLVKEALDALHLVAESGCLLASGVDGIDVAMTREDFTGALGQALLSARCAADELTSKKDEAQDE